MSDHGLVSRSRFDRQNGQNVFDHQNPDHRNFDQKTNKKGYNLAINVAINNNFMNNSCKKFCNGSLGPS